MTGYPKTLHHPQYRRGHAVPVPGTGKLVNTPQGPVEVRTAFQGIPDLFPPLTVHNPDHEAQARAKGYLEQGEAPPPMADFSEYPLMLSHPDYEPETPDEVTAVRNDQGQLVTTTIKGKPAKMPHVFVNTLAEEKAWHTKGYRRPGKSDPQAAEAAKASPYVAGRVTAEYTKVVDGKLVQDPGLPPAGPIEYPKWITTGKDPDTGDPIGKEVKSRAEEIALCERLGLPLPGTPKIDVPAAIATYAQSVAKPLTRGQRAAATRAANKALKAAQSQPAA
jgi:hypothetical protein